MSQSKIDSILEQSTGVIVGVLVALAGQYVWFPLIGKQFTGQEQLSTVAFFTILSMSRGYIIRRLFNGRSVYETIKGKLSNEYTKTSSK